MGQWPVSGSVSWREAKSVRLQMAHGNASLAKGLKFSHHFREEGRADRN